MLAAAMVAATTTVAVLGLPQASSASTSTAGTSAVGSTTVPSLYVSAVTEVPGTSEALAVGAAYATTGSGALVLVEKSGSWTKASLPATGKYASLTSVVATSSKNAWAVGSNSAGPLMLHWNGSAWSVVTLPHVSGSAGLSGIGASSATSAWAVGANYSGTSSTMIAYSWNGSKWALSAKLPALKNGSLIAVTVRSRSDAWAVGAVGSSYAPVLLHWNGSTWAKHTLPHLPGSSPRLGAVAVGSTGTIYVAGSYYKSPSEHCLLLALSGSTWKTESLPATAKNGSLNGLATSSGGNVWAVGTKVTSTKPYTTVPLVLHSTGGAWSLQRVTASGTAPSLDGVSAQSPKRAYAVGYEFSGKICASPMEPLAFVWNGKSWSAQKTPKVVAGTLSGADRTNC